MRYGGKTGFLGRVPTVKVLSQSGVSVSLDIEEMKPTVVALFFVISAALGEEISDACMECLCETMTGCNLKAKCSGATCGPFRISWGYWADGGKFTVDEHEEETETSFSDCAADAGCAGETVRGYMTRFAQDCNGDGVIDCDDYMNIHIFGGYGCSGQLPAKYLNKYKKCRPT